MQRMEGATANTARKRVEGKRCEEGGPQQRPRSGEGMPSGPCDAREVEPLSRRMQAPPLFSVGCPAMPGSAHPKLGAALPPCIACPPLTSKFVRTPSSTLSVSGLS